MRQSTTGPVAFVICIALLDCTCSQPPTATTTTTASATATATATASATASATATADSEDEVKPVYPVTTDPPDPLAVRLCDALHALPAKRKAACCGGSPGFHPAAECARTLSSALRARAVTLAAGDVDRCIETIDRQLSGCDWVAPLSPPLPAACEGLVKGALAEGASCRSSLECADGLHCAGAGPTDAGRCRPPKARGSCGTAVDTLAAHTRQARHDEAHPECAGYCARRACADAAPAGGACKSHVACGRGRHCAGGKCSDAPLPEAGSPCLAGLCAAGARCVQGRCESPRPEMQCAPSSAAPQGLK